MFCAISGETPQEPVASKKTGHVFEKRVILKWLETNNGKDPVSDGVLTLEDLIPLQGSKVVKPRPTTATSIPSLLQTFQNEWDALVLETYSLKEQLDSVRQELAHALYQHDAACRVIARLIKERDEARNALGNVKTSAPVSSSDDGMEVEGGSSGGISEDVRAKLAAKSAELSKERKNRVIPQDLATAEEIKSYQVISTNTIHKTSPAGATCLDINPRNQDLVVSGGNDKEVIIFNRNVGKLANRLTGHTKAITDVLFHPTQDIIFSTSKDKTAKVWTPADKGYAASHTVTVHQGEVVGCSVHATGDYWVTISEDSTWAFHDIATSAVLSTVNVPSPCSSLSLHPDGLILATGTTSSEIKIWDIKTQKNVASFEGHTASVSSLSFSENGYYLASSAGNTVKLWDLRKLKNFHSIDVPSEVTAVEWDHSGSYLAVSSNDLRVFMGKALTHIATFSNHTKQVTDVKWGDLGKFLISVSLDRTLKAWGKK